MASLVYPIPIVVLFVIFSMPVAFLALPLIARTPRIPRGIKPFALVGLWILSTVDTILICASVKAAPMSPFVENLMRIVPAVVATLVLTWSFRAAIDELGNSRK